MLLAEPCSKPTRDTRLIHEAQLGDREAFGELVLAYRARLHSAILPLVLCPAEADDVVQETVIRAFEKLPLFQGHSGFFTWLYRIAVNRALSRRRQRHPALSLEQTRQTTGDEPRQPGDQPDSPLLREEQRALVQIAISKLDADQRAIVVLRYMDGCDFRTIARVLDIQETTARTRLHRARRVLEKELTNDQG